MKKEQVQLLELKAERYALRIESEMYESRMLHFAIRINRLRELIKEYAQEVIEEIICNDSR